MQYIIYISLIVILAIIIYGALSRKRVYSEVDRLEAWKIQIMNKPITDEISKIKGLNMSGETEKKFEIWRNEWDEILTLKLPDIEEELFDVEEAANKYRFIKAKNIAKTIAKTLNNIENSLQEMMDDINLLVDSELGNRQQIDGIQRLFKDLKQYYSINKGTLGTTAFVFEKRMAEIDQSFVFFETATQEGNYFEARELLMMMKEQIELEMWKIDEVPKILVQIENEIPSELEGLSRGIQVMEEEGYVFEHFSFKQNIVELKKQLDDLLSFLEEGNIEATKIPIADILKEIELIYDTLEDEVLARQYVTYELTTIKDLTKLLHEHFTELKYEVEMVKLSYRISEEELKIHLKLEKELTELTHKLKVIEDIITNKKQSYIVIKKSIEKFKTEVQECQENVINCQQTLTTLRKDELKAHGTLQDLKAKIRQGHRLIKKSNIPGLPISILMKLEESQAALIVANEKMENIPLAMEDVNASMEEALQCVNDVYSLITFTIEQALAAEQVIQYGNRYRSDYPYIYVELVKAEQSFRLYEYEEALEIAYKAIEKVDPNVLENLKITVTEEV
ncbi:septation ring formation regulator EzrA [Bacillaceae bacterium IKA-2]|jgi:septation ring formation regulator|nr:septation ring formation regulator EzrA [Bacillaceae bacterium IKA-2]